MNGQNQVQGEMGIAGVHQRKIHNYNTQSPRRVSDRLLPPCRPLEPEWSSSMSLKTLQGRYSAWYVVQLSLNAFVLHPQLITTSWVGGMGQACLQGWQCGCVLRLELKVPPQGELEPTSSHQPIANLSICTLCCCNMGDLISQQVPQMINTVQREIFAWCKISHFLRIGRPPRKEKLNRRSSGAIA